MKKIFQLFFVLFLVFAWCTTYAQDKQLSNGPIPQMKGSQNHTIVNTIDNLATIALAYNNAANAVITMPLPAGDSIYSLS